MTVHPTSTLADDSPYWEEAVETQTRADWEALKLDLLKAHLQHAYQRSPYYRASFDAAGVHPDHVNSLDDLRRFPFIDKQAVRERQLAVPPFGDLVAVPERDVVYISASSGSTGVPTASPFTARDFDDWIDYEARQFWSSGLRPADRYCHCLNFSLFVGGPCVLGAQKLGALSIHAGTLPSERLLLILRQFQATAMWTTPSYAWYLGETAARKVSIPGETSRCGASLSPASPAARSPRRGPGSRICGARLSTTTTGCRISSGSCAGMCEEKDGLHWAEDHILVEVLDPATGDPVAEGERGELVLTTLRKSARPMIRFRTGDIVSFTSAPCRCGRTSIRMRGTHGRLDDMVIIKGVNIFPSDVEALVRGDHGQTGEYRLVVERVEHLDRLTVELERRPGLNETDDDLAERFGRQLRALTG